MTEEIPKIRLTDSQKTDLFLLFKEMLTNALRHSKASQIRVEISFVDSKLKFCIKDNGIGFDVNTDEHGRGTDTMRTRKESLGGTLTIESFPGSGTTQSFVLKLQERWHFGFNRFQ